MTSASCGRRSSLRKKAREQVKPYENMRWEAVPWRVRAWAAVGFPYRTWRIFREWVRQVTALPGDHFWDLARDIEMEVVAVKPNRITLELRSGQILAHMGGWKDALPAGCVREYEIRQRTPWGWWL